MSHSSQWYYTKHCWHTDSPVRPIPVATAPPMYRTNTAIAPSMPSTVDFPGHILVHAIRPQLDRNLHRSTDRQFSNFLIGLTVRWAIARDGRKRLSWAKKKKKKRHCNGDWWWILRFPSRTYLFQNAFFQRCQCCRYLIDFHLPRYDNRHIFRPIEFTVVVTYLFIGRTGPQILHNATSFGTITAIRIDFAQQFQVATRFSGIFTALHFAVDDATIFTVTGDVVNLGDEAGILQFI